MENVELSEAEVKQIQQEEQQAQEQIAAKKGSNRLGKIIEQTKSKERFDTGLKAFQAAEGEEEEDGQETAEAEEQEEIEGEAAEDQEGKQPEETEDEDSEGDEEVTAEEEESEEEPEQEATGKYPEWMKQKLAEADADLDLDDEEQVQKALTNLVEDHKALAKEREANQVVYDLFENNEEMVELAKHMHKGDGFLTALARTVDLEKAMEELEANDPEEYKKMIRAQVEREAEQKRLEKEQEALEEEFEENTEQSLENMDAFFKDEGLDEAAQEEFKSRVDTHISNLMKGKLTPEFLEVLHKGLNYEVDLEKAKEKGKLEGKNQKIQATRTKKKGDGLPTMKNGKPTNKEKKEASRGKRGLVTLVTNDRQTFARN